MVGPELILGKLFDEIEFNQVPDRIFRHLVLSRLVFPLSKLKTSEYLLRYHQVEIEISQIYHYLDKLADAGLLSNSKMELLLEKKYEFILGGRVKNEPNKIKELILGQQFRDGQSMVLQRDAHTRLIVNYAAGRAKKDASNRVRGLNKLEKAMASGKLNKAHINNRGYNKYLRLEGEVNVSIDYEKFRADARWDGLKGYITNSPLPKESIIENYRHLGQIEKAFRISKTDLRIRPIYHRLPGRISAHIIIAFTAYKLYKELERQLKQTKSYLSVEKAIEVMKSIYRIKVKLPESKQEKDIIFAPDPAQKHLLAIFNVQMISD